MEDLVIVVDDDKEIRELVTFALQRSGFEVQMASDGDQLQALLTVSHPQLIILDVMMPGESGYQIFQELRSDPNTYHIPVIILTAHVEDIYGRISTDLGAAGHMTKPFHPLALVEKVRTLLATSASN